MDNNNEILQKLYKGLIVSCQALQDEPLHGPEIMARMAKAAEIGGAVGIRANGVSDIAAIKKVTALPLIGIIKIEYPGYEPYITPTLDEVKALVEVGVEIVAVDATHRLHPGDLTGVQLIQAIKKSFPVLVMADISVFDEGLAAAAAGADLVSTTLSGYTAYSPHIDGPDFGLIRKLSRVLKAPLIAEGRIETPEQAGKCMDDGAFAVVVGGAITRPQLITKRYVSYIKNR